MSRKSSGQQNPYFRQTPDMSQRHPAIFLNVFAGFFKILSHRAPSGFPVNSGRIPSGMESIT
jgi:hypothetical protein